MSKGARLSGKSLKGFAIVLLAVTPTPARASATLNVPTDYPTISAAINAAANGDTIVVAPGTYIDSINFQGKAITVQSAQGPAVTAIDGTNHFRLATFTSGEGASSILQGFTIERGLASGGGAGTPWGGGIDIEHSSPTIVDNVITGNQSCYGGDGIYVAFGSPLIQGNVISNNSDQAGCIGALGGGVYLGWAGPASLIGNTIYNNSTASGGGVYVTGTSNPTITGNRIYRNTASIQGGGLYLHAQAAMVQNLIYGNGSPSGGGAYFFAGGASDVVNNTFADNSVSSGGTGADLWTGGSASQIALYNNIFSAAQSTVFCDATYDVTSPTFDHNDAVAAGGTSGYFGTCASAPGNSFNIAVDPLFASPPNADYHLTPTSPAIDGGNNTAPQLTTSDLDGNPRVSGIAVDLGAFEFQQPAVSPKASYSPAGLNIGGQAAGTITTASVTLTNTGNATLTVSSDSLTGSPLFSVGMDGCTGSSLSPGTACAVAIKFFAHDPGNFTATLWFADNAGSGHQYVPISATGLVGRPQFTPSGLDFGSLKVNRRSTALTVTVTNIGNATLTISAISISGTSAADFAIGSNTCTGAALNVGESCAVSLTFRPRDIGVRSASLTFATSDPAGPYGVPLSGTGTKH